jgi:hypothetical protein
MSPETTLPMRHMLPNLRHTQQVKRPHYNTITLHSVSYPNTRIIMQNPPTPAGNDEASIPIETASMSNGPNMKAEAPIPTETVSMSNDSNMNRTVTNSRKAAKRTLPWDLNAGELLVSQDEDNSARKKPRLQEPLPTATDEAAGRTDSPAFSVVLPPPAADNDDVDTNADAVTDTQPNTGASTWATCRWTTDEDAKLTSAVANTSKKKWERTVARIGIQWPHWFWVERDRSVVVDGIMSWIPASA